MALASWIPLASCDGQAQIAKTYECYSSGGGFGGKKDGKWYFKARLNQGKLEINPEPMNESQAVEVMDQSGNILTLDIMLAEHVVEQFEIEGASPTRWVQREAEVHDNKNEDHYYYHLHYGNKSIKTTKDRLHCWMWKSP